MDELRRLPGPRAQRAAATFLTRIARAEEHQLPPLAALAVLERAFDALAHDRVARDRRARIGVALRANQGFADHARSLERGRDGLALGPFFARLAGSGRGGCARSASVRQPEKSTLTVAMTSERGCMARLRTDAARINPETRLDRLGPPTSEIIGDQPGRAAVSERTRVATSGARASAPSGVAYTRQDVPIGDAPVTS